MESNFKIIRSQLFFNGTIEYSIETGPIETLKNIENDFEIININYREKLFFFQEKRSYQDIKMFLMT